MARQWQRVRATEPIGEMSNFEELAGDCAQDGVFDFPGSGVGLKITGSVGSPLTPMAIK
jgi:hypothetical protein